MIDGNNAIGMSYLTLDDDDYRMDVAIDPVFAHALGEDRLITIFNQTLQVVLYQVENRAFFAMSGAMRYPGCHSDVVFNAMGMAA